MSVTYKSGFTIIETMLFLAVTGVLIVGILAGTGTSVNIQRYRDSVSTLKSVLQEQYSKVTTVNNEIPADAVACNNAAAVSTSGITKSRGQSDCVVMGRYIAIDGSDIYSYTVIGHAPVPAVTYTTDINEFGSYALAVLPSSAETTLMEWNAQIAWPVSGGGAEPAGTHRTISLLILRSPTSGLVYTFSSNLNNNSSAELRKMVQAVAVEPYGAQTQRRICVDSNGGFGGGMSVLIGANASSGNSVQVRSNDMDASSVC